MVPTDPNTLIKKVSIETGFPEKVCREIIHFYWNRVRHALVNGKSHSVYIRNFGYLKASSRSIDKKIYSYERLLSNLDNTKNPKLVYYYAKWRISVLRKLQSIHLYDNFIKRKTRQIRARIFRNLEESQKNSARINKFIDQETGD